MILTGDYDSGGGGVKDLKGFSVDVEGVDVNLLPVHDNRNVDPLMLSVDCVYAARSCL